MFSTPTQIAISVDERNRRSVLGPGNVPPDLESALEECLTLLDSGEARVAEPGAGGWVVNEWLKKAVLLSFRTRENVAMDGGFTRFYDKVPLKYALATDEQLRAGGARIVPHAVVRRGAYIAPNVVLMPSYVNIGAWVGPGTLVDTWATVGSCAQIGRNVHLSGGVGIGGVLEPLNARPVIVEDDAFIGSRAIVTEGVVVGAGAILGANVVLTASTPVVDVTGSEPVEHRGAIPPNAVVVPGTRVKKFPAGEFGVATGLIIGWRSARQESRVSLNDALREFGVSG